MPNKHDRRLAGHWQIRLLGQQRPDGNNGDWPLGRFAERAAMLLLTRLALNPDRTHSREELAAWLWPGRDGRARFGQVPWAVKKQLEPPGSTHDVVFSQNDTVALAPGSIRCDAAEFDARAALADHAEQAFALYPGPLLPGVDDAFVEAERARLQAAFERVCALLGRDPATIPCASNQRPAVAWPAPVQLPHFRGQFLGRDGEIAQLLDHARASRVVVVVGVPGVGKSRLCVEAAHHLNDLAYRGFVSLKDCRDELLILDHVRATRQLQAGTAPILEQLAADLGASPALLILDNVDQLVGDAGIDVLAALLQRLPRLLLWLTSSVALSASARVLCAVHHMPLQPLPLPDRHAQLGTIEAAPSIRLLADRIRAVDPEFHLHRKNAALVRDLCRLTAGLPLAIEEIAAQMRHHTLSGLRKELQAAGWSRFANADDGDAPLPARQTRRRDSVARIVAWRKRLSEPPLRNILLAATACRGGWTLTQMAAVAALPESLCRDSLQELSAVTWASAIGSSNEQRYELLRDWREWLGISWTAGEWAAARRRHRLHFLRHARRMSRQRLPAHAGDVPNLEQALRSSLEDGAIGAAVKMALALHEHRVASGLSAEALAQLHAMVEDTPPQTDGYARFLASAALLFVQCADGAAARNAAARAVDAATGDSAAAMVTARQAQLGVGWRTPEAGETFFGAAMQVLRLAKGTGRPELRARALAQLGVVVLKERRNPSRAALLSSAAEQIHALTGDEVGSLLAATDKLVCLLDQGHDAQVIAAAQRGREQAQRMRRVDIEMLLMNRHGLALEKLERWSEAVALYREQADEARARGMTYHLAYATWNQCWPLLQLQRYEEAARLTAFISCYWPKVLDPLSAADEEEVARLRLAVGSHLGVERLEKVWSDGERLEPAEGLALACGRPPFAGRTYAHGVRDLNRYVQLQTILPP